MNISSRIIFFAIGSLLFSALQGQIVNEKIKQIRQEFKKINSDTSLKRKTIDNAEEFLGHATDGGGQLTGFFSTDSICKIVATVGLSYGQISDEYYFKNGQLIFVYEVDRDFPYDDSTGSLNFQKIKVAFEGRYYFDKEKLIGRDEKGTKRFESSEISASDFLNDAKQYTILLKSKK